MVDSISVLALVDNRAAGDLAAEHGLSFWIEVSGRRIVFDTGQGPALSHNASKLHVPLSTTDIVVLSHGHFDHTGGLPHVLSQAPNLHVYCHPGVTKQSYSVRTGSATPIHIPSQAMSALEGLPPERLHWTKQAVEIAPGVGITGSIPRLTDYEDVGGPFFLDREGKIPDPIDDDIALWMNSPQGLVVVVGCSHAGLINTLKNACRVSKVSKVHAVLGGFHLLNASEQRLDHTISALMEIDPDLVVPCHCTGERQMETLQQALGKRVSPGQAGATYLFESAETNACPEAGAARIER